MSPALEISLESASAIESLVARLRKQALESAQALDLERSRSRRLYKELVDLGVKVKRLEAEQARLVVQLGEALMPRSM